MPHRMVLTVLTFCSLAVGSAARAASCEEVDGIESICDLQAPEDLVLAPDGRFVLFSQMVPAGGLKALDTRDDSVIDLYPAAGADNSEGWGASDCPGPPGDSMEAHGIDLRQRSDGRWVLLVVNHGGRESLEFFELLQTPDASPQVQWRGCVLAPEDAYINDVVLLPDGGFLATHMFSRSGQAWGLIKSMLGFDTGYVYRWDEALGFIQVPGTDIPFPNGIALAADDRYFFVNSYSAGEVRKYALKGGEPVAVAQVSSPDNSSWDSHGRLLVASHQHSLSNLGDAFPNDDGTPIDLHFIIVALDPNTLDSENIWEHQGPPMGGATVALEVDGYLYMGSFAGDRMIRIPMP